MVLEQLLPGIEIYLQLGRFFLVLAAGVVLTRLVLMPAVSYIASRRSGDKVTVHSFSRLAGAIGLLMSFILALQAANFGSLLTVLGTITAALTVAIGFGMRDQVSNVVGGFFLYADHPFVKGDYIKVNDQEGEVREIGLRHTVINGGSSEKVVLPNSVLTLNPVRNYTRGRRTKTSLEFRVDPGKASSFEKLALEALEDRDSILSDPAPEVVYSRMEEEKVVLELHYWIKDSHDLKQLRSEVLEEITGMALEEGIFSQPETGS